MSDNVPAPHYASVQMQPFGNAALPALQSLADVVSIAQLMAKSQMAVPKHLRENPGACLAVTMQALRWNADPFAVANKSYYVNDRMAYEAQMFAAVINTMAPIKGRPRYSYEGEGAERVCIVEVTTNDGEVIEQRSPKFGAITPKNSPLWKSDPDQQQGYYTIRTMARRHFPDVVLGIYDPEEMESIGPQRIHPEKEDLVGKLAQGVSEEGFSQARVEVEVAAQQEKPKRTRKPKDEPEESMHAEAGSEEASQENAPIDPPSAEETPNSRSASDLEEINPAMLAEGRDVDDSVGRSTHAAPGEVYLLAGDGYNKDQRRLTYKDGARFSSVHKASEGKYRTYAQHAPVLSEPLQEVPDIYNDDSGPQTVEEAQEQVNRPTETAGAQPAEPEPDTSETATPASDDGAIPEGDSGPSAQAGDGLPDDLAQFIEAVESAPQWADVKKAMASFYRTHTFESFPVQRQNKVRASTWAACVERRANGEMKDLPDHADDMSAFRLWLEWISGDDAADAVRGTFYALQRGGQWKGAPEASKANLSQAVEVRLGALS